jgi:hypothetical protein
MSLLAATAFSASAQITVEVTQPQDQFLTGEALPVTVRIMNLSGQTLHLGGDSDWLTFSVESREGVVVPQFGTLPVFDPFDLPSSRLASKRIDLSPCFPVIQVGRYNIIANVKIREWEGREIASRPKGMDIINGVSLWQQEFGVPPAPGQTNGSPEIRRYILQQANYVRGQVRLYLRVTDLTGARPPRVVLIGPLMSFSRPEQKIDQDSDLHVLYQDGPHSFSYSKFSPDAELLARQTHDYVGTRPRLRVDADGNIFVFGGVRRITSTDVPPPKPAVDQETPPPAADPETAKPLNP